MSEQDDVIVIGEQCFASLDETVINWKGVNYVPQENSTDVDTFLGYGVNEFTSEIIYSIFNDDTAEDIQALPKAIREQLTKAPMMEDVSMRRVVEHARLMNEDRARMTPPRSPVVVKAQTVLKTPWTNVPLE